MQHFDEISVERINVVDPEGRNRFLITHGGRHPDRRRQGAQCRHALLQRRRRRVRRLAFTGAATAGGYDAGAVIALDQFRDDQCVSLESPMPARPAPRGMKNRG
jgi:hypothetical protein